MQTVMNHPMLQQVERSFNDQFRTDSIVSELADQAMKGDYSRISLDSILAREVDSETFTNLMVKLREAHSQGAHPQVLMDMFNALMKVDRQIIEGIAADLVSGVNSAPKVDFSQSYQEVA